MARLSTLLVSGLLTAGLTAGGLVTPTTAYAQSPEWTATLMVQPSPSPFLADWERNPRSVVLNLFYTGSSPRDYRIEIFARAQGRGELGRIVSPPQFMTPGPVMQVFTSAEALEWERLSIDGAIEDLVLRTGVLPEGVLELCARVVDLQGAQLTEGCDRVQVALPSPPQLVLPENGGRVAPTRAVFQWTPVVAPPGVDIAYRVRIVERFAGQAPHVAINANPPVYQDDLSGAPILVYPLDALPLEEGREYAWQVEVVDALGRPLPIGQRAGEIWTFQPGDPFALPPGTLAELPDELTLIPGVAQLRGLNSAHVTEVGTAYRVDGRLTLEILAPFRATLEVRAEELEVGGLSFAQPTFRSGRLRGRLAPGSVPESLTGGMVALTELEYDPLTGLTLTGQFRSPAGSINPDATLGGRVAITATGLRGVLTAQARSGGDLFALGGDPVKYTVRRLELSYPTGALLADGELELFGEPGGCGRISGRPLAGERHRFSFDCGATAEVPLLSGAAAGPILGVERVKGWIEAGRGGIGTAPSDTGTQGAGARGVDFELELTGALAPEPGATAYRTGAVIRLTPGEFALTRIESSPAGPRPAWDLGVVRLGLENLRVPRLAYDLAGRSWDFDLLFDARIQLPGLGDPQVPAIEGVSLRPDGITIPGTRAIWPYANPVTLEGFTIRPLGLQLDTLRLDWSFQSTGASAGLSLDLELGFGPDAPPALSATKLRVEGAGYRDGRITGTIRPHGFTPALRIPIGDQGMAIDLRELAGSLTADAGRQVVTIDAQGSLLVPAFMRCGAVPDNAGTTLSYHSRRSSKGAPPASLLPMTAGDTIALPAAAITLSSNGFIQGRATGLVPTCPIHLGPIALQPHRADLEFKVAADTQRVELEVDGSIRLPAPSGGTPVMAKGILGIDLVQGRITRGAIEIDQPFRWTVGGGPAGGSPFLGLVVSRGRLDAEGLTLTGAATLELPDGGAANAGAAVKASEDAPSAGVLTAATATVELDDLTLALPEWRVTRGQARISGALTLAVQPDSAHGLSWRLKESAGGDAGQKLSALILDAEGIHLSGELGAELAIGEQKLDLAMQFTRDFLVGIGPDPIVVRRGRGTFLFEESEIAYVDPTGFWFTADPLLLAKLLGHEIPGEDDLPERIGLPAQGIAYLQVKENGNSLVKLEIGQNGARIRTRADKTVDLVIPALAADGAAPPVIAVELDAIVDTRSWRVVDGSVRARGHGSSRPIFTFEDSGIEIAVTEISLAADPSGSALVLRSNATTRIGGMPTLRLDGQIELGATGLSGSLTARAEPAGPLMVLGAEPVRLQVKEARLDFPAHRLQLDGDLELLGRTAPACGTLTASTDENGKLTAHAVCAPNLVFAFDGDGADGAAAHLSLGILDGTLTLDPVTGAFTHALEVSSRIEIPTDLAGHTCVADFAISLEDGELSLVDDSLQANCTGPIPVQLGWVEGGIGNLTLEKLHYTPGDGLDFALRLDLQLRVPGLLEVPDQLTVLADRTGLTIPETDLRITAPPVTLGGFGLRVTRVQIPGFSLGWRDWTARSPAGLKLEFDAEAWLADLPQGAAPCLGATKLILNGATVAGGRIQASITEQHFEPACAIALGGETSFEITRIAGDLALRLTPELSIESLPAIDGALRLPSYFTCATQNPERRLPLNAQLRLDPRGGLTGKVTGLTPGCPIDLPAVRITATDATLDFALETGTGRQNVTLQASASATFNMAENPVHGAGSITIDLLAGEMIDGSLTFAGPIRLDLPRQNPVLSFDIGSATFDTKGLHINGRGELRLTDSHRIGATFDEVTIHPLDLRLTHGSITFDRTFALEAGIGPDGNLAWTALPAGSPLGQEIAAGMRVDLPTGVALTPTGFNIMGTGSAYLLYEERALAELTAEFTDNFTIGLRPVGVADGLLTLRHDGATIATIDRTGFRPYLGYFLTAALPARLPLPTEAAAYLELRDEAGEPRVELEIDGPNARIFTQPGTMVPLVFPALAWPGTMAPRMNVSLDLTLDPTGREVRLGSIGARISADNRAAFDLSEIGIPFAVDSVSYSNSDAGYRLELVGHLTLLDDDAGAANNVVLTLDGTGKLEGAVQLSGHQGRLAIGPDADRLHFAVNAITGEFSAAPARNDFRFHLDLDGELTLALGETERFEVAATIGVSDVGVSVKNLAATAGAEGMRFMDLDFARLGLGNLTVPHLTYDGATGDWDFELLFDAAFEFPAFADLRIPEIRGIALRRDGLIIPEISAPELTATPFELNGFQLQPLAFRMQGIRVDWFNGIVPDDWGFAFDFALGFGADAPHVLRNDPAARLTVLDAGYRNGHLTGTVELRNLGSGIEVPLADGELAILATSLGGSLSVRDGSQIIDIAVGGSIILPESMRCSADPLGKVEAPGADLRLSSSGRLSGVISNFVPACPLTIGPLTLGITSSELSFTASAAEQEALLDLSGALRIPGPQEGTTITAHGDIGFDLIRGRLTHGAIEITEAFSWALPAEEPVFDFIIQSGRLDTLGLRLSGGGTLRLGSSAVDALGESGDDAGADATVGVTFSDLTLRLPDFSISAGSVAFNSSFALSTRITDTGLEWRTGAATESPGEGAGFHIVLPETVILDRTGLRIDGRAAAQLAYGDKSFPSLGIDFIDNFALGLYPVAVDRGRAEFYLEEEDRQVLVAHLDTLGFWPGDIFSVLPIPARLGLPTTDVAYLELRQGGAEAGQVLVRSTAGDGIVRLYTDDRAPVKLFLPALAAEPGAPIPSVEIELDIAVNPVNFQIVGGEIAAVSPEGQSLLSLAYHGLALDVRGLRYAQSGGAGRLTIDADAKIPQLLGDRPLRFDSIAVTSAGLSGTVELGTYKTTYDAKLPVIHTALLSPEGSPDSLRIELTGARVSFGTDNDGLELAGLLHSTLFAEKDVTGESRTVPLFITGSVGTAGISLAADPSSLPGGALPLGLATLTPTPVADEPALQLRIGSPRSGVTDLVLRLSGVLTMPGLNTDFGLTVVGLEVGTTGITVESVAIQNPNEWQELQLFGATFTLRDSIVQDSVVYPALAFDYADRVLTATLSGEIEFLDNTTHFHGLQIGTDGMVRLAAASLISSPIAIIDDVLTLDSLTIAENKLRAAAALTLPKPVDGGGAPHRLAFAIGADGTIEGGGTIILRNEKEGLDRQNSTLHELGAVTVHPRYIALDLNFGRLLSESAVEVVSDFYLDGAAENRIRVGKINGGEVLPGLRIGFDGDLVWGNLELARKFEFDFDPVRLELTDVSLSNSGEEFAIGFSGNLGLKLSAATGSIQYSGFTITSTGGIDTSTGSVTGGSFEVGGVITLALSKFEYSGTPTDISVAAGSIDPNNGPTSGSKTINVSSYVRFGGSVSIEGGGDGLSGSIEEFLLYTAPDGIGFKISNAELAIYDAVKLQAELVFEARSDRFEVVIGGRADLLDDKISVAVVGAIAKEPQIFRIGAFFLLEMEAGLLVAPPAPILEVNGLGGGFFYNPKSDWINTVKSLANVSESAKTKIDPDEKSPRFAIMLFGAAAIVNKEVAQGRVLLTVTPTEITLNGAMSVLPSTGDRFTGEVNLTLGLDPVYFEGEIKIDIDYGPVVDLDAKLNFAVYDANNWMVLGTADAAIMGADFLTANANIFVGPPGFNLGVEMNSNVSLLLLSLKRVKGQVWYYQPEGRPADWGAMLSLTAGATIIPYVIEAEGTLMGALIGSGTRSPFIYAVAEMKVETPLRDWEGSVWAKISGNGFDAGVGRDPAMEELIARANRVAREMDLAKQEAQTAMEAAKLALLTTPVRLSDAELAAAFKRIQTMPAAQLDNLIARVNDAIGIGNPRVGDAEMQIYLWGHFAVYLAVLRQAGAPGDSALVERYGNEAAELLAGIIEDLPQVEARIAAIQVSANTALELAAAPLPDQSDIVRGVSFNMPTTRQATNEHGQKIMVVEGGPSFEVDTERATQARYAMESYETAVEQVRQQTEQRIQELETALAALRAATTANDAGSLLAYAQRHGEVLAKSELQFATHVDFIYQKQVWAATERNKLYDKWGELYSRLDEMSTSLITAKRYRDLHTITKHRAAALDIATGKNVLLDDYLNKRQEFETYQITEGDWKRNNGLIPPEAWLQHVREQDQYQAELAWFDKEYADEYGLQLLFDIGYAGLKTVVDAAAPEVARTDSLADERLGSIREIHGSLSESLDRLFESQADLTGVLQDLYDRYLWQYHGEKAPTGVTAPVLSILTATADQDQSNGGGGPLDTTSDGRSEGTASGVTLDTSLDWLKNRRAELARSLQVPSLTDLRIYATPRKFKTEIDVIWSGTHPSGTYEFLFRDYEAAAAGQQQSLFSNGNSNSLVSHRYQKSWTQMPQSGYMQVGVRGGAGFTAIGGAEYKYRFSANETGDNAEIVGKLLPDHTPPGYPSIKLPGLPISEPEPVAESSTAGYNLANPDADQLYPGIMAGIGSHSQFAIPDEYSTLPPTGGDGIAWTSDRSRIDVEWSATSPTGIGEYQYAIGTSPNRADIRPWTTAGGRTRLTIELLDSTEVTAARDLYISVKARNGYNGWSGVTVSPALRLDALPPVFIEEQIPVVSHFREQQLESVLQLSCRSTAGGATGAWDSSMLPGGTSAATPQLAFTMPVARDEQSGLSAYYTLLDTVPEPASFTDGVGWTSWPVHSGGESITISGEPLEFLRTYYLTVVAVDRVGNASEPMLLGPYFISDPTSPTSPLPCTGIDAVAGRLRVNFQEVSSDPETGIVGYEYRVRNARTGAIVQDWPEGEPYWRAIERGATVTTPVLPLVPTEFYFLDVRAVNGAGMRSQPVNSGRISADGSPPPTPAVSFSPATARFVLNFSGTLTVTAPTDPESGLENTFYRVVPVKGNQEIVGWTAIPKTAGHMNTTTLRLELGAIAPGSYRIEVKSVNGAGLHSSVASTTFEILDLFWVLP